MKNKFAERIKELRLEKQLFQKEVADALGVTQATLSHWESGNRYPDYNLLIAIAEYYDCSIDFLIGYKDV